MSYLLKLTRLTNQVQQRMLLKCGILENKRQYFRNKKLQRKRATFYILKK